MRQPVKENLDDLYLAVRGHEGRLYTDDQVGRLPVVVESDPFYNEWLQRRQSAARLKSYFHDKFGARQLRILDLGCGNGWMSNLLYKAGHNVTGVDTNRIELLQAGRVFGSTDDLTWYCGDIFGEWFNGLRYDIIILAASCQYFPNMDSLSHRLKSLLHDGGEIHLLDSKFYNDKELAAARQRSVDYYFKLGYPQMALHYFHHSRTAIKKLGYRRLRPGWMSKFSNSSTLEWWVLKC